MSLFFVLTQNCIRLIIFVLALGQFLNVEIFNLWTYYKKKAKKQNHIYHREAIQLFIKIIKNGGGVVEGKRFGHKWGPSSVPKEMFFKDLMTKL